MNNCFILQVVCIRAVERPAVVEEHLVVNWYPESRMYGSCYVLQLSLGADVYEQSLFFVVADVEIEQSRVWFVP